MFVAFIHCFHSWILAWCLSWQCSSERLQKENSCDDFFLKELRLHSNFAFINIFGSNIFSHLSALRSLPVTQSLPTHHTEGLVFLPVTSLSTGKVYQGVSFTLTTPHQINKTKYLMSRPFSSTYSACFNSISRHSSGSEYINAKIKMPFCPRAWHLAKRRSARKAARRPLAPLAAGHGDCSEKPQHSSSAGFVSWKFLWKKLVSKGRGVECYFIYGKQITLSLILQAFFAGEKKSLLYFKIFSMVYSEI